MTRTSLLVVAVVVTSSSAALADDAKARLEEGLTKMCQTGKDNVGKHPGVCDDEIKAFSAVDCGNKEQRKTINLNALESACQHKVLDGAKKVVGTPRTDTAAHEGATPCKAVDEAGAVLAETTVTGLYSQCNAALHPLVLEKCAGKASGATIKYGIVATWKGEEKKSSGLVVCPIHK